MELYKNNFVLFWNILCSCCFVCSIGSLPTCKDNDHVIGEWRLKQVIPEKKSFFCCQWNNDDYLRFPDECGTREQSLVHKGLESIEHMFTGDPLFPSLVGGWGCYCDMLSNKRDDVTKREMFEWVPTNCVMLPWDAVQFCDLLGDRTMLLAGDSLMQQSAATLMSMVTKGGGHCSPQIKFGSTSHLVFNTRGHESLDKLLAATLPDICILNVGAWFHDDGDMYSILETLKDKLPLYASISPKTKYVWKTMSRGHVGCKERNFTAPVAVYYDDFNYKDDFNWRLHPNFDQMAKNYSYHIFNFPVIDMEPLFLRPDAHPAECLHYCVPGPLDIFSNLVLQTLYHHVV